VSKAASISFFPTEFTNLSSLNESTGLKGVLPVNIQFVKDVPKLREISQKICFLIGLQAPIYSIQVDRNRSNVAYVNAFMLHPRLKLC